MINQFSTRMIAPARRVDAWNDVMDSAYAGLSASPLRPGFSARIARLPLGQVMLSRPVSTPAAVERRHRTNHQPTGRTLLQDERAHLLPQRFGFHGELDSRECQVGAHGHAVI